MDVELGGPASAAIRKLTGEAGSRCTCLSAVDTSISRQYLVITENNRKESTVEGNQNDQGDLKVKSFCVGEIKEQMAPFGRVEDRCQAMENPSLCLAVLSIR